MMNYLSKWITLVFFTICLPGGAVAEVLQRISDETATPNTQLSSSSSKTRRITYRVLCSPGDEALPDCEQPYDDAEGNESPGGMIPTPDLPPDVEDAIETPEPENSPTVKPGKPREKTNGITSSKSLVKHKKPVSKKPLVKKSAGKKAAKKSPVKIKN